MPVAERHAPLRAPHRRGAARGLSALFVTLRPVLLAYGLLGCGLLAVLTIEFDPLSQLLSATLEVVLALSVIAVAMVWCVRGPWRRWAPDLTVATAGAYAGLTLAGALHATPYPPLGLLFDSGFRVQAVSRYMDTWHLADLAYQGLPAFYPPVLPYAVGHAAAATGMPAYLAWKYAIVLVACAVPVLAYLLWRQVLPATHAALVSLAVLVPRISFEFINKPDEWLVLFLIVPWWLAAIYEIRQPHARRWPVWVHGIVGALLFCTYYYFYFILALTLLLAPLLDRWHPPRPGVWRRRLSVVGIAAVLSAVYWAPLLASILAARQPAFLQSMFFPRKYVEVPLPMFSLSVVAVILLGGLGYALWTVRRDHVSAGLVLLLLAGYVWYILGLLAAAVHHPVLVHHSEQYIVLVLAATGIRALTLLGGYIVDRWPRPETRRVVAALAVGLVFLAGQQYMTKIVTSGQVEIAQNQPMPSGRLPRYHAERAVPPATTPLGTLRTAVAINYEGRGRPVVLAEPGNLLDISPFYAFSQQSAIYAHPAAEFPARLDLLQRLEATTNPRQFARTATHNRFDAIDAMVLRMTPKGLRFGVRTVDYPEVGVRERFYFTREQLSARFWKVIRLDDWVVAVRRTDGGEGPARAVGGRATALAEQPDAARTRL